MKIPKFATEAEEADWWFHNQDVMLQEFRRAAAEGRLGRGTLMRRAKEAEVTGQSQRYEPITLDLAPEDAAKAYAIAQQRGLDYRALLTMLIHESLAKADAA